MAGVNPALTQSLLRHITSLRDEGMTVLFVEHDMDVVMEISDWVVVLAQGQVIAEAPPTEVVADEAVIEAYLGEPPRPVEELEVPDLPHAEAADT
jgi:branched-chain amino acid transport system ATP-binding protein